jgi:hypothetical protein
MDKRIYILIFCFLISVKIMAQNVASEGYGDRVTFKNGSQLYGKVLSYAPDDTLVFALKDGKTFIFLPEKVLNVRMEKPPKVKIPTIPKPYNFRETGFYGAVAYSNSFGKSASETRMGVGLSALAGWQFIPRWGVGGGVSFDQMYLSNTSNILSIFGETRYYLKRNRAEYGSLLVGYGMPLKHKNDPLEERRGGLLIQPMVGWRLGASARYNFFIDIGARFQRVYYRDVSTWMDNQYTVTYQRWILRGGIIF